MSPPPRTPRAPPPPPTCKTCWIWRIEPNPSAGATFPLRPPSTYFSVKANCDYAKAELDKVFDGFRANGLIKSGFTSYSCRVRWGGCRTADGHMSYTAWILLMNV